MSDTNAAPAATNNRKKLIGALAIVSALLVVGSLAVASVVWWNLNKDTNEVAATTPAPTPTVDPATKPAATPAPAAAEPTFTEKVAKWWKGHDEPDLGESPVEPVAKPATAATTPVVTASAGFTAHGTSFPAPDESGMDAPTAEVMLGEVADSARSASGRTEVYWVQGTHEDALTGARVDRDGKVVDPDDIRRLVGVNTTWTAIPDNTGVTAKCVVIHANDDDNPGSCLPVQTASR